MEHPSNPEIKILPSTDSLAILLSNTTNRTFILNESYVLSSSMYLDLQGLSLLR